jgi:hypothetical protein
MEKKSKLNKEKHDQSEKNEAISKELKDIVDKISKNFDFKSSKKQNMNSLEEVIIDKYNLYINKYSVFLI